MSKCYKWNIYGLYDMIANDTSSFISQEEMIMINRRPTYKEFQHTCKSFDSNDIIIRPIHSDTPSGVITVFPKNEYKIEVTFDINPSDRTNGVKLYAIYESEAFAPDGFARIGVIYESSDSGRLLKSTCADAERQTVFCHKNGSARIRISEGKDLMLSDDFFYTGVLIDGNALSELERLTIEFELETLPLEFEMEASLDDEHFSEEIQAKPGDHVLFKVLCRNIGDRPIENVYLKSITPLELEYAKGSTFLMRCAYSIDMDEDDIEGIDDISGKSTCIGSIDAGETVTVTFYATIHEVEMLNHAHIRLGGCRDYYVKCRVLMETADTGYWRASIPVTIEYSESVPKNCICLTDKSNRSVDPVNGLIAHGFEGNTHLHTDQIEEVVFNSIIDDPVWGDQRSFVYIREADSFATLGKSVVIHPGQDYEVALLYANNRNTGDDMSLRGTRFSACIPKMISAGETKEIIATLSSMPYEQRSIQAKCLLIASEDVFIRYIEDSAHLFNQGDTDGADVNAEELFGEGWKIQHMIGVGLSGFVGSGQSRDGKGYILFRFSTEPADEKPQ